MGALVDLSGHRFGRLSVVSYAGLDGGKNAAWRCACDCGVVTVVRGSRLRSGVTASCGCLISDPDRADVDRVGDAARRATYSTWTAMRSRCRNKKNPAYPRYGGRGISICDRWSSFDAFVADVGMRPFTGAQLDRIDNDVGYEPGNCRWTTPAENSRNRSSGRLVETPAGLLPLWKASEISGISSGTLAARIRNGWSAKSLFRPTPSMR